MLENINSPSDLNSLGNSELEKLADEIREFIIGKISQTGGHLASNLGVVELTLALHKKFESPADRIIWDVGHQSYVHKILTGRKDEFENLRQFEGMSGFPKGKESPHDAFDTGHASTSISAAVGMAKARDLKGDKGHVVAVIGDGALTGGLALEALNHVGQSGTRLIVILNDNGMSITKNVGGISKYLNRIRTQPFYYKMKSNADFLLNKIPKIGSDVANWIYRVKGGIKYLMVPGTFFEEMGIKYLGPIDGHNISDITDVLERAKQFDGPIILHIHTVKGKGYSFAEARPDVFHGISEFDVDTGKANKNGNNSVSASKIFGQKLCSMARKDNKIVAITAAMPEGTGLKEFSQEFPERFFDVGIAEEHAVTFAAGLAKAGMKPVVAVYSSFLQRAYDQILHDVCLQKLPVVFMLDRAGIVGEDGETHHGIYDLSYLSHMTNINILAPSCSEQLESMLDYLVDYDEAPVAIRYPKDILSCAGSTFQGFGKTQIIKKGKDATLISVGAMLEECLKVQKLIPEIDLEILDLISIKPLDGGSIVASADKTKNVFVVEDNCVHGGAGSLIQDTLPGYAVTKLGYPVDSIPQHGRKDQLFKEYGMDAETIAMRIKESVLIEKNAFRCVSN